MRHLIFEEAASYPVALLIKGSSFNKSALVTNYTFPLTERGIAANQVIGFTLEYNEAGKAPVSFIKAYLDKLLPALGSLGVKMLYVADSAYFKTLTKMTKAEPHHGYVLPCAIKGFEHMSVVLGINHQALIYNPELQKKLDLSLKTLSDALLGSYQPLGANIIHSADYPETLDQIEAALEGLHQHPIISCDIETRSLRFYEAGVETIAFGLNKHKGISFCVEKGRTPEEAKIVKQYLKRFFTSYTGKVIYHNASYDIQILIYELWMKPL